MKKLFSLIILLTLVADTTELLAQKDKLSSEWQLIFSDEFNGANGSAPNAAYWKCSPRGWSTWNRWISNSADVAFIKNGKLICRAIRNDAMLSDTAQMLTGAVETQSKFSFQYGKIEVRAKTKPHPGSFPAIWLLPEPPAAPNPIGGEIDIFESFGDYHIAHHTIHSNWTYNLKQTTPHNEFKHKIDISRWHVYGVEWTEDRIVFSIDGRVTGSYEKSKDKNALENGQWPFDHPFYIILNQSLRRKGIYGGDPDLNYVYETQFDWVRVYKRRGEKRSDNAFGEGLVSIAKHV